MGVNSRVQDSDCISVGVRLRLEGLRVSVDSRVWIVLCVRVCVCARVCVCFLCQCAHVSVCICVMRIAI